jgi:hypothetical protein
MTHYVLRWYRNAPYWKYIDGNETLALADVADRLNKAERLADAIEAALDNYVPHEGFGDGYTELIAALAGYRGE